jgi:Zn finger protein HypA/HybF involved in hydrogenase expression
MIHAMFEVSIKCPKCDGAVMLNGPWESAHCNRCQNDTEVPHEFWIDMIKDIRSEIASGELAEGEGRNSTIFGMFSTSLLYGRLAARCEECKTPIEIAADLTEPYVHTCPKCSLKTPVSPAPDWLAQGSPGVRHLVAAEAAGAGEEPAVSGPIAMSCTQCGGNLLLDGKDRLVPCQYCGVNLYLPDDLWFRLHPVKTKTRWFVGFE